MIHDEIHIFDTYIKIDSHSKYYKCIKDLRDNEPEKFRKYSTIFASDDNLAKVNILNELKKYKSTFEINLDLNNFNL